MLLRAVQRRVLVQPGGRVELAAPELPEGAEAEVIVLVHQGAAASAASSPLEAFEALKASMGLTPEDVKRWTDDVRAERDAWGRPE